MAIGTRQSFARTVLRMTERVTIRARIRGRGPVRFLVVANSARRKLATRIRFTRRRMTRVAIVVGREVCGNRQTSAAIHR